MSLYLAVAHKQPNEKHRPSDTHEAYPTESQEDVTADRSPHDPLHEPKSHKAKEKKHEGSVNLKEKKHAGSVNLKEKKHGGSVNAKAKTSHGNSINAKAKTSHGSSNDKH
jgi:hypothetical protein